MSYSTDVRTHEKLDEVIKLLTEIRDAMRQKPTQMPSPLQQAIKRK